MKEINGINYNINKIVHISDIHIRLLRRHNEYKKVFDTFYKQIQDIEEDSIIIITGDLVHSKLNISPELIKLLSNFLIECSKLRPTFFIKGNHDMLVNNKSRLDAISPIFDLIKTNPNLHYLNENEVYKVNNILLFHYPFWVNKEEWINPDLYEGDTKICLFHGPVYNSTTDIGFTITSKHFCVEDFNGFDIVMLGDIHRQHTLQPHDSKANKPIIAYAGSMIQQNFGENVNPHGYLLWDVKTRSYEIKEVHNEYQFITLFIKQGKLLNENLITCKRPRIRLKVEDTSYTDLKVIMDKLKTTYNISELKWLDVTNVEENSTNIISSLSNRSYRDIKVQQELMSTYIDDVLKLDSTTKHKLLKLNKEFNNEIPQSNIVRNVLWYPKTFKFSNIFSYGEDNIIDFSNMKGLYGIFASNRSGKSSLMDALTFTCFDRTSKTSKASDIINNQKDTLWSEFTFSYEGREYIIERTGYRKPLYGKYKNVDHVKVDIKFYERDPNTQELIDKSGESRVETIKIISSYLGTYEDFILTTLSLQNNNTNFIDKTQKERKEMLVQLLDVTIFEELFNNCNEILKNKKSLYNELIKRDVEKEQIKLKKDREDLKDQIEELVEEIRDKEEELNNITINLDSLYKQITKVTVDKDENLEVQLTNHNLEYDKLQNTINTLKLNQKELEELLDVNLYEVKVNIKTLEDKKQDIIKNEQNKIINQMNVNKYNDLIDLSKECLEDITNITNDEDLQKKYKGKVNDNNKKKLLYESKIIPSVDLKKIDKDIKTNHDIINKYEKHQKMYNENKFNITLNLEKIEILKEKINILKDKIKLNKTNIILQNKNEKLYEEIEILKVSKETNIKELKHLNDNMLLLTTSLTTVEQKLLSIKSHNTKLTKLSNTIQLYENYINIVKRDGLPYQIITGIIPILNHKINNILGNMVDFKLELVQDDKNIECYIVYDDKRRWSVELGSGMEKFISMLAIRTSLIEISNLPRPPFLCCDEGFGVLDKHNLISIENLFDVLKGYYDFLIIISHLPVLQDVVDDHIIIEVNNNLSSIEYYG